MHWQETKHMHPPENVVLNTKMDDDKGVRMEQKLIFAHGLWWDTSMKAYVYYTPTPWSF